MFRERSNTFLWLPWFALVMCVSTSSAEPINAVFELRKAAHEPDTVLNAGEALSLDVYVTLSSAAALPNVHAISWFLLLDSEEDNAILYNHDFVDESGMNHTLVNRIDNDPVSGILSRAAYAAGGVPYANGQSYRIGHFSVTALDPGPISRTVAYTFGAAPPQRPWVVDFVGQNEVVNISMLPTPVIEVLPPIACATIVQWRSVRTHGSDGDFPIILNPSASGNGKSGPTVETRDRGIQKIEVDFNCPVSLSNPAGVTITGRTTSNGALGPPVSYTPTSISMVDTDTMVILFDPGVLPNQTCYAISISPETIDQPLFGDNSINVRVLAGDTNGDGLVAYADILGTKMQISLPSSVPQHDVNVSGGPITYTDVLYIKTRITSPLMAALCL